MVPDNQNKSNSGEEYEKVPMPMPGGTPAEERKSVYSHYAPTVRDIKSTVNVGLSNVSAELKEEFLSTATTAMNEVIEDFRTLKISCYRCGQKLDVSTLRPFSHFECPICGTDLKVPEWFGSYILESPEGMGGMATVYKSLDLTLDREVAIKILNPTVAQDQERCELFLNEARTAATINHFAVIPIYTCGEHEGQPYIVMQYMKNGSLEEKISTLNPPSTGNILSWMKDVTEGLECAYKHGIIHHDIKPGNIMVDNSGVAKIGDFGIAQAINDSRATKIFEMTKAWVSPHYVSPEKAVSNKEDYLGDIYSLGASFYHLATGCTPFKHDDIEELIKQRLLKIPVPPHKLRKHIPKRLSNLILSMMNINPLNRPGYKEILSELKEIIGKHKKSSITQLSPAEVHRRQYKKFFTVLILLFLWMAAVLVIYNYLSNFRGGKLSIQRKRVDERVMRATGYFRLGNSVTGVQKAMSILDPRSMPKVDMKRIAMLVAIGNYLNDSRYIEDNCTYVNKKLEEAGVSHASATSAIIGFMVKKKISPEELRQRLKGAGDVILFAANFAIFIRELHAYVYEDNSLRKVNAEFSILKKSAEKINSKDWVYCWKKRLPLYEKVLNKETPNGEKLEPLLKRALTL